MDLPEFAARLTDLQPWQKHTLKGMAKGELKIMMAGRNMGKSHLTAQALHRIMKDLYDPPFEGLDLSEGTILGARYYTVEPLGGNWAVMEQWCKDTFGEPMELWGGTENTQFAWPDCGRWHANNRKFWFRDLKDRDWFIMKWNA